MQLGGRSFRKGNIYLTHISSHTFDKGYIYFFMVVATSMRKGIFILLEEQAASIPKEFIYSIRFAATSPSTRSCYFIGTPATSFQKNISTLQPLHNSRLSSQHRSFHCQRVYGKSVFACLVRGGDYIMWHWCTRCLIVQNVEASDFNHSKGYCYKLCFSSKHVFAMLLLTLFYFILTCIYLKVNMCSTYVYLAFTSCFTCVCLEAYTFLLPI